MKTIRPYFLRAVAVIAFSCVVAWLFQQWRLNDRPKFVPPQAEAFTQWQQEEREYFKRMLEISSLEDDLRHAVNAVAIDRADEIAKKLKMLRGSEKSVLGSVEFGSRYLQERIPAGATDPDSVWKGQMQNARDTLRSQGIPAGR